MKKIKNNEVIIDSLSKDLYFTVKDNEHKTFLIFLIDDKDTDGEVKIVIDGAHAQVQILGIIIGSGNQKIRLYTLQDHKKPESMSDLFIKTVLFDSSRFYYEGMINIRKDAQKSNAYQKNQNLLLSPKAWADSKPYLEILANDVRCTHGATIGKINKDQLHYLQTRGFDPKNATQLLTNGFFSEVLQRIDNRVIKVDLEKKIENKLIALFKKEKMK